jgi:LPS-assembly lipoprotein
MIQGRKASTSFLKKRSKKLLALIAATLLGSCGFRPLYAPGGQQDAAMSAIFVDVIPDRQGQLLREALQAHLEGTDNAAAKRFTLSIAYAEHVEGVGIQNDNSSTRTRVTGDVTWSLKPLGIGASQIAGGKVRALDGYDISNEQFFYADLSMEALNRRIADALADQITQAIAVYFRKHPSPG